MVPPSGYHKATSTRELRALASPARQEFLTGLQALQPCTMKDLADYLGRLPVSLYYHLKKLEAVGLVVAHGERETERGTETLYRLPKRGVRIEPTTRSGASLEAMRKIGASIFRLATRLHAAAVSEYPARTALRRKHLMSQRTLRLTPAGLQRVNAKLLELIDMLDEEKAEKGDDYFTVTLHLAPNPVRGSRTN